MREIVPDRMTQEDCETWCLALESGKYAQGCHYLRSEGAFGTEFCCLGVYCEVSGFRCDSVTCLANRVPEGSNGHSRFMYMKLPSEVQTTLMRMNDFSKDPFPTIAKYIRESILPTLPKAQ